MAETFIYFAYGSNMLTRRLKAPGRTPSACVIGIGFLAGRRLTFDKVSTDGSGKCDAEYTGHPTDKVWGVLFGIDKGEEPNLDRAEGYSASGGYDKDADVEVRTSDGTVRASTYFAKEGHKDAARIPYHWYKAFVVAGAVEHNLPSSYVEWLRAVESKPDQVATRRESNEALLFETN